MRWKYTTEAVADSLEEAVNIANEVYSEFDIISFNKEKWINGQYYYFVIYREPIEEPVSREELDYYGEKDF